VLLADGTSLVFIKTTNEIWARMREPKETYHMLIVDLTKSELQIEPMLRTVRQDTRYGQLPIVVFAGDRELSEMVRSTCSFVVFLPLAAPMLREALVWCFDRKSIQKFFQREEQQEEDVQCVIGRSSSTSGYPDVVEVS